MKADDLTIEELLLWNDDNSKVFVTGEFKALSDYRANYLIVQFVKPHRLNRDLVMHISTMDDGVWHGTRKDGQ